MSEELRQFLKEQHILTLAKIDEKAGIMIGTTARISRSERYRHFTDEHRKLIDRVLLAHYKSLKKYLESTGTI